MTQLTIDMPEGALAALHQDPIQFVRELRLAAAVKWYEMRRISQGRAAEIAGVSRSEFITALGQFGISPFQEDTAEIVSGPEARAPRKIYEAEENHVATKEAT
jgi:predicted HTH domain antitoxin